MSAELQTKVQASPAQNFVPAQTGLLQRKSALCNTPGLVEDSGRDKEKPTFQRSSVDQAGTTTVPPIVPRFGHDFSKVSVHSTGLGMIQAKLKINEPGDPYEQEADRVADAVMRMPENAAVSGQVPAIRTNSASFMQRQTIDETLDEEEPEELNPFLESVPTRDAVELGEEEELDPFLESVPARDAVELGEEEELTPILESVPTGETDEFGEEEEEELIQPKSNTGAAPQVTPGIAHDIHSFKGTGQPLPASERTFFEPRFGRDFSNVRVHTDNQAARTAQAINARAFTFGHNVVFGAGEYSSDTLAGRKLIAHELAHVVQQSGKSTDGKSMLIQQFHHDSSLAIWRKQLFSSTMTICHRILKSRTFKVSQGSVSVIADAKWIGPGTKQCGAAVYPMTLTKKRPYWFDSERGSCNFRVNRADIQTWTNVPSGDYYLTIWPNNTNPYCCLNGTIKVLEQSGVKGPSCGGRTRNEKTFLDVLHLALDGAGMIPALGVIPDAANATIYLIEGNWTNAGISTAAMIPIFGQGVTITKLGVKVTAKAVKRVGKKGIERGLKKAAKEKAAKEAAEKAAKGKAAKETAEEASKKGKKGKKDKAKKGKHTCFGRSFVLQIPKELPKHKCPEAITSKRQDGPSVSASSEYAACVAAKHAFNAMMLRGCRPKHIKCVCKKR